MKRIALVLLMSMIAAAFVFGGGGRDRAGVVNLTFSNVTSESAARAAAVFKEVAERESGGTLYIIVHPDNQLGNDADVIEGTRLGNIDIAVSSTSPLATIYPDFFLFDAPFLFLGTEEAWAGMAGPVGQQILRGLEGIGFKGLAFWENGFRNFTNNRVPVRTPADVRGMTVRTMPNPVHLAAWNAFGANPTPMAFLEVFTALQQGTIDAQENPLGIIDANRFHEVQRYVSMTQHVYTPFVMVMNLRRFNALTPQQQQAILRATEASTQYQLRASQEIEQRILRNFANVGVTVVHPTMAEKAQFQQIVIDQRINDQVRERMSNPQLLDQLVRR